MSIFSNPASSSAEQTESYVAALLDLLGDRIPLEVLASTSGSLEQKIGGLSAERLTRPEAPGKWSARHVLQHLADSELVGAFRFRMVLSQERPAIVGYDQDAFADRLRYDEADAALALETFQVLRSANVWLLERVSEDDLKRIGVHNERGEESIAHMMKLYAAHDLLHLRQIDRILDAQ